MAKRLLCDIETFPYAIYTWGVWEQSAIEIKELPKICCFSAKWIGSDNYITYALDKYSEADILTELHKLLDEAEIVITHNGDKFDLRRINAQFAKFSMLPPSPYKSVDTKRIAKSTFAFPYNSLAFLGQHFGIGDKLPHNGFEMWKGCMAGDPAAWKLMKEYNQHDIYLLEGLYNHLLPWIKHPNISLDGKGCPKCGSDRLQSRGVATTTTRIYQRYQCQKCGGWSRETKSLKSAAITNA